MANDTRILIFQPFFTEGSSLDYRLLGLQYWLAGKLANLDGIVAMSMLATSPGPAPKQLIAMYPPTDPQIQETMQAFGARFGLLTSFAVLGGRPHLAIARLAELARGPSLRILARWKFDGDNDQLPVAANHLFSEVLKQIGTVAELPGWQEAFGTADVQLASNYLTALGCHASCEEGAPIDQPEAALHAVLSGVANRVAPAIELLPLLVRRLRSSGSAPDDMLEAAVRAGVDALGSVPASWRSLVDELGIVAPSLHN